MANHLTIKVDYNFAEETYEIKTDFKRHLVAQMINEYLQTQVGRGKDESPPNKQDHYEIIIQLHLSDDSWRSKHDCGNEGLMVGLLMTVMNKEYEKAKK